LFENLFQFYSGMPVPQSPYVIPTPVLPQQTQNHVVKVSLCYYNNTLIACSILSTI